jgi:hypothetical protein
VASCQRKKNAVPGASIGSPNAQADVLFESIRLNSLGRIVSKQENAVPEASIGLQMHELTFYLSLFD